MVDRTWDPMQFTVHPVSVATQWCTSRLAPLPSFLPTAQQDPGDTSQGSPTIVYAVIGSGVALVVLGVLVVGVLLGKRRRVMAKIWRPTSPSEASPSADGTGNSGAASVSAAPSALSVSLAHVIALTHSLTHSCSP